MWYITRQEKSQAPSPLGGRASPFLPDLRLSPGPHDHLGRTISSRATDESCVMKRITARRTSSTRDSKVSAGGAATFCPNGFSKRFAESRSVRAFERPHNLLGTLAKRTTRPFFRRSARNSLDCTPEWTTLFFAPNAAIPWRQSPKVQGRAAACLHKAAFGASQPFGGHGGAALDVREMSQGPALETRAPWLPLSSSYRRRSS